MTIKYRKEIDGLRTLAVFSVVANHINLPGFNGGFIGVDVFFIISGFLIFQIINSEKLKNNFSFINFYERRARRILPALYLMTAFTTAVAFFVLLPKDLKYYGKSLAAVVLMCSNLIFPGQSGYFDQDSELMPLLHTWSLGVEEQFYLLFPALVVAMWKLNIKHQLIIYLLLATASLLYANNMAYISPEINFFMLRSRLWELLFGAIGAIIYLRMKNRLDRLKSIAEIASFSGMFCILYSILYFDEFLPYPSYLTLIPTTGTLLLLLFANQNNITGKILSLKFLVAAGICSYSVYLWHQPIFAFFKYQSAFEITLHYKILLIASVFAIGWLSFNFIEKPARHRIDIYGFRLFKYIFLISSIFILIGALFYYNNGFISKYSPEDSKSHYEVLLAKEYIPSKFNALQKNKFHKDNSKPKILVIGDSFAQDLINAIYESEMQNKVQLVTYYISSRCGNLYINDDYQHLQDIRNRKQCPSISPYLSDSYLVELMNEAEIIWLASSWKIIQADRLKESIDNIESRYTAKVFLFGTKDFGKLRLGNWMRLNITQRSTITGEASLESQSVNNTLRRNHVSKNFIDLSDIFCTNFTSCAIFDTNGNLLTPDGRHLSFFGAKKLGYKLNKDYPEIFFTAKNKISSTSNKK